MKIITAYSAIKTLNDEIDFDKEYIYIEDNYPGASVLFMFKIKITDYKNDDWDVWLKGLVTDIYKDGNEAAEIGHAFTFGQARGTTGMWPTKELEVIATLGEPVAERFCAAISLLAGHLRTCFVHKRPFKVLGFTPPPQPPAHTPA